MPSLHSCSESRTAPYSVSYFIAQNNHLQFDWLNFDNSKQFFDCLSVFDVLKHVSYHRENFCKHWLKLLRRRS